MAEINGIRDHVAPEHRGLLTESVATLTEDQLTLARYLAMSLMDAVPELKATWDKALDDYLGAEDADGGVLDPIGASFCQVVQGFLDHNLSLWGE